MRPLLPVVTPQKLGDVICSWKKHLRPFTTDWLLLAIPYVTVKMYR